MAKETFTLEYGIEVDGANYDKIELRRPKAKDFKKFDDTDANSSMIKVIANLCSVPGGPSTVSEESINDLDFADYTKLAQWLGNLSSSAQKTE